MTNSRSGKLLAIFAFAFCAPVTHAASLFAAEHAQEENSRKRKSGVLVTPDWLAQMIEDKAKVRIIDLPLRKTNYAQGHIPGAISSVGEIA